MEPDQKPLKELLLSLQERAKELNCLYRVDEILSARNVQEDKAFQALVLAIPPGWQYPEVCKAALTVRGKTYVPEGFTATEWSMSADVVVEGEKQGTLSVCYTERRPKSDEGPFLKEERRLINAIAERIGFFVLQRRLRRAHESWQGAMESLTVGGRHEWFVLMDFLRRSDPGLLERIARKMVNHLYWSGAKEAEELLAAYLPGNEIGGGNEEENRPQRRRDLGRLALTEKTFALASKVLTEKDILSLIQDWIQEEKSGFLMNILESPETGLSEIAETVEKFLREVDENTLPVAVKTNLRVSLLRRCFTSELAFINAAKHLVDVRDFNNLLQRLVYPGRGQGRLGGKSAGLFLARKIIERRAAEVPALKEIRFPESWYLTSDALLEFIHHNDLEDLYNRKYMDPERIRHDYPYVVQLFKNSPAPPELTRALSTVLDQTEGSPLIVRSSSLLEDRAGSTFSGKYKSLFLANLGTKKERLEALWDAVAEVYASLFGPDPIEYRAQRELLDVNEEMAIVIQAVVGRRVGRYFLPAFSGVAFSHSDFRWSPRMRREDGLLRLVPGLGTRAVDRLSDDYPILVSPGKPGLRVNASPEEVVRYAPRKMDVIDLESRTFKTVDAKEIFKEYGSAYPLAGKVVSIHSADGIRRPGGLGPDWERDDVVVTFAGLLEETPFLGQVKTLLDVLERETGSPVDIEFAHDGASLYLVQCRTQSHSEEHLPPAIPRNIPRENLIFSAERFVSNGRVTGITHIVYVDPENYAATSDLKTLRDVGRAIGRLNKILPKRQFILMGPGRWGSRGDIKLGVPVTYSDINNTAMLIEIARRLGNYVPELSFGTHFFQDLVEADIRYLPLYPDEPGNAFDLVFLRRSKSILTECLPEFAHLAGTVRVIDIPRETEGSALTVLMNEDLEEAAGVLVPREKAGETPAEAKREKPGDDHARWRGRMAERLAARLDPSLYGIKALYLIGSAKNGSAGPGSDIDLIVHFGGTEAQRTLLSRWFDGWSQALAEMNYLRTGYAAPGLLDVHYVSDEDIANRTSFAAKINAVTDGARALNMGESEETAALLFPGSPSVD
jgi:pyruvate, water dikinase